LGPAADLDRPHPDVLGFRAINLVVNTGVGWIVLLRYMVTHQEEHWTRGRARLLFEMLHGTPA
jgi:hypothetical protein